jgi:hypothetical protein
MTHLPRFPVLPLALALALAFAATLANGQTATVLRDLDSAGRVTLTKDELTQLMPNAGIRRVSVTGNNQSWKNDSGGTFIVSSDNKSTNARNSTASGKWHISDDGRYCVLIEWKRVDTEEWCRYIVKAGNDYYATKSEKVETEKVYKLEISK